MQLVRHEINKINIKKLIKRNPRFFVRQINERRERRKYHVVSQIITDIQALDLSVLAQLFK
jgi:hypothetical protein